MPKRALDNPMWNHFEAKKDGTAKCKICAANVSYKSTTGNLKKHIKRNHPSISLKYLSTIEELSKFSPTPCSTSTAPPPPTPPLNSVPGPSGSNPSSLQSHLFQSNSIISSNVRKQTKITDFSGKKFTERDQASIEQCLLKMIILDYQPFSIVEDKGFREYTHALNPNFVIPGRKKISKYFIPAKYEACKQVVKTVISNATKMSLTTDCWTSANNESFIAVTAHFVTNGQLQNALLTCESMTVAHTKENLAAALRSTMKAWDIESKVMIIVSDNASNISGAITEELKMKHFGCAAHKLNLVANAALDFEPLNGLVADVKKIVNHFRRSPKSFQILKENQKLHGFDEPLKLIISVPTRWNSTFHMLERFVKLEIPLKTTIAMIDKDLPVLSSNSWAIAKDVCVVLAQLDKVTKLLSGDSYPTASILIPLINGLRDVLGTLRYDPDFINLHPDARTLIDRITLELGKNERFGCLENSRTFAECTFIDPRFKGLQFKTDILAEQAKLRIKDRLIHQIKTQARDSEAKFKNELQSTSTATDYDEPADQDPKKQKLNIWGSLTDSIKKKVPTSTAESAAIIELNRYLEDKILDNEEDPIEWWNQRAYNYPNLSRIAMSLFSVVSTSVPCERVFSKAGLLVSDRRTRLSAEKAKMLVFLNTNLGFLENK